MHEDDVDSLQFQPGDAIESLRAAILRIDTLASLASDACDEFRCSFAPEIERGFARLQILVAKTAEEARTALAEGDGLMVALTRHLRAQRANLT